MGLMDNLSRKDQAKIADFAALSGVDLQKIWDLDYFLTRSGFNKIVFEGRLNNNLKIPRWYYIYHSFAGTIDEYIRIYYNVHGYQWKLEYFNSQPDASQNEVGWYIKSFKTTDDLIAFMMNE